VTCEPSYWPPPVMRTSVFRGSIAATVTPHDRRTAAWRSLRQPDPGRVRDWSSMILPKPGLFRRTSLFRRQERDNVNTIARRDVCLRRPRPLSSGRPGVVLGGTARQRAHPEWVAWSSPSGSRRTRRSPTPSCGVPHDQIAIPPGRRAAPGPGVRA
jgi:hypothetical protein